MCETDLKSRMACPQALTVIKTREIEYRQLYLMCETSGAWKLSALNRRKRPTRCFGVPWLGVYLARKPSSTHISFDDTRESLLEKLAAPRDKQAGLFCRLV